MEPRRLADQWSSPAKVSTIPNSSIGRTPLTSCVLVFVLDLHPDVELNAIWELVREVV